MIPLRSTLLWILTHSIVCDAALYQFAYCSTSTSYEHPDLEHIVSTSRILNQQNDVTGILLYKDESFLQIIEGEEQALKETVFRITKDPRHKHIVVLYNVPIDSRDFQHWQLALRTPKFTPQIKDRFKANDFEEYITDPTGLATKLSKRAQTLLTVFEEHM